MPSLLPLRLTAITLCSQLHCAPCHRLNRLFQAAFLLAALFLLIVLLRTTARPPAGPAPLPLLLLSNSFLLINLPEPLLSIINLSFFSITSNRSLYYPLRRPEPEHHPLHYHRRHPLHQPEPEDRPLHRRWRYPQRKWNHWQSSPKCLLMYFSSAFWVPIRSRWSNPFCIQCKTECARWSCRIPSVYVLDTAIPATAMKCQSTFALKHAQRIIAQFPLQPWRTWMSSAGN